jgi:plastocyanin
VRRALVLVTLVALAAPAASAAGERQVGIHGSAFDPRRINIVVGDSLRWSNHDFQNHNIHTDTALFPDHTLNPNTSWSPSPTPFTSENQTGIPYVCTIHANMAGTIAVWNVWLGDPAVATYGSKARFTGLAHASASIQIEKSDGTPVGAPAPASGSGAYTALVSGLAPGLYRANDGTYLSRTVTLKVKPKLTITKRKVRKGVWAVSVKAAPNQKGATATVDRKKGFGWAKLASKSFGASSKAAFTVKVPTSKSQLRVRVRLTKAQNNYSPATSASFVLKR